MNNVTVTNVYDPIHYGVPLTIGTYQLGETSRARQSQKAGNYKELRGTSSVD